MRFYDNYLDKNNEIKDKEIIKDIHKAADWYENGAIIEAMDLLSDIMRTIEVFIIRDDDDIRNCSM